VARRSPMTIVDDDLKPHVAALTDPVSVDPNVH
jgi:hypothetical protein